MPIVLIPQNEYFLPHYCVLKDSSITTKLDVVFNELAETSNGISLNDIHHIGLTVQEDLFLIALRFYIYALMITSDVKRMCRQVLVHENNVFTKYSLPDGLHSAIINVCSQYSN